MAFDGKEGENVSLTDASQWTENFRTENPSDTKGHFFGKDVLNTILGQAKCKGIRFYNAINDDGDYTLVAAGVRANENDQVDAAHTIAEYSKPCPPNCGQENDLNS